MLHRRVRPRVRDITELLGQVFKRQSGKRLFVERASGCYEWLGGVDKDGYGQVSFEGQTTRVTRLVYTICIGELLLGDVVRHTCDNVACIRPKHLLAGTQQDNIDDKVNRGRQLRGERHHKAKITMADAERIRELYQRGILQADLARLFGIAQTNVSNIIRNKNWK